MTAEADFEAEATAPEAPEAILTALDDAADPTEASEVAATETADPAAEVRDAISDGASATTDSTAEVASPNADSPDATTSETGWWSAGGHYTGRWCFEGRRVEEGKWIEVGGMEEGKRK